jgi:hypothetical protein
MPRIYQNIANSGRLENFNIGVIIRASSQVQEEFFTAQKEVDPNALALSWVHNVCTRMLQNIEDVWTRKGSNLSDRPRILDERLSHREWHVVAAFQKILQPFKIASKQLQGNGITGKRLTQEALTSIFQLSKCLLTTLRPPKGTVYEEDADRHLVEYGPQFLASLYQIWLEKAG